MKKLIILLSIFAITNSNKTKYCDIKGNVNNPGVYKIDNNYTIQDVINISGGLKKGSYTNNINLSKKVTDEMVIYISTEKEIKYLKSLNDCDCSPKFVYIECDIEKEETKTTTQPKLELTTEIQTTIKNEILNKKVNINKCNIDELLSIKGLGETKATKIIEYRNNNGYFKNIEEIMNVSGIGETLFNQIKDYIEV